MRLYLRREFGSLMYENSEGHLLTSCWLGYKSLKTTQKYLHLGEHGYENAFR